MMLVTTKWTRIHVFCILAMVVLMSLILPVDENALGLLFSISLVAINIFFATKSLKRRMTYLLFNLTIFTFLQSKELVLLLSGQKCLASFSMETAQTTYLLISLSLVSLTVGQMIYERRRASIRAISIEREINAPELSGSSMRNILIVFYMTFPFAVLTTLDKVMFVNNTSYLDYYTTYSSALPYLLVKIGELNRILFVVLFCTEYRKKKLIIPLVMFTLNSLLSLGFGQRNIFVLDLIMIFLLLRHANARSIQFGTGAMYSRKTVWIVILLMPFMVFLLYQVGNVRTGISRNDSIGQGIVSFFESQGGQVEFLSSTIEYRERIWSQPLPYSLAAPYNYIRNLFGLIDYSTYSAENAYYGNSLAATQFFITSPGSLISGKGAGCCYISELFYDLGIPGVILGSVFLGFVAGWLRLSSAQKWWENAFVVLMIRSLVYIPRASLLDWISTPFNIWNVVLILLLHVIIRRSGRGGARVRAQTS